MLNMIVHLEYTFIRRIKKMYTIYSPRHFPSMTVFGT